MIRLALLLLLLPGAALACACCAERGERFAYEVTFDDFERGELARLEAEGPARLFLTACGFDCVYGLDNPQESYGASLSVSDAGVVFALSDESGQARGLVGMNWPGSYVFTGVDTDPLAPGPDAQLYTEVELVGPAYGEGDFAGDGPLRARLIFAGRGNMCFQAGGLAHWSLEVLGEGVRYRLFGGLTAP